MSKAWPVASSADGSSRTQISPATPFVAGQSPIVAAVSKAARRFQQWRATRETVTALSKLDSRALKDIGVARHDIPEVAKRAAAHYW